jgi:hypothetical protein
MKRAADHHLHLFPRIDARHLDGDKYQAKRSLSKQN